MGTNIKFDAPPTIGRWMSSTAFGRLILGPIGSGKTTAAIMELVRRAAMQAPGEDGLRHTRFAVIRQTFSQLRMTVLKDVLMWLEDIVEWKISEATLYINFDDIRSEWLFLPLDEPSDERRLLSTQLTGAWINEFSEVNVHLIDPLGGRCGRFPRGRFGVPTWTGIIGDSNFPTENSDWHEYIENCPAQFEIFKQPGGRTPEAENIPHLNQNAESILLPEDHPDRLARGREYYARAAQTKNQDWVRRYVDAEYGRDPSGTAVFANTFVRRYHCVPNVEPVTNKMLIIGQDFGRNPWSIITQVDHRGRLLIFEEAPAEDTGIALHVKSTLRPILMNPLYVGRPIVIIGDPAGKARESNFEINNFEVLNKLGFKHVFPAPTNDIELRIQAVEYFLGLSIDGGPGILISELGCPNLIAALNGGYRYSKTKEDVSKPKPDKNESSHVVDALQYVCLMARSAGAYDWVEGNTRSEIRRRETLERRGRMPVQAWT
jgi:Terminase large subunit, T4likevirus-type, N-terminal